MKQCGGLSAWQKLEKKIKQHHFNQIYFFEEYSQEQVYVHAFVLLLFPSNISQPPAANLIRLRLSLWSPHVEVHPGNPPPSTNLLLLWVRRPSDWMVQVFFYRDQTELHKSFSEKL